MDLKVKKFYICDFFLHNYSLTRLLLRPGRGHSVTGPPLRHRELCRLPLKRVRICHTGKSRDNGGDFFGASERDPITVYSKMRSV